MVDLILHLKVHLKVHLKKQLQIHKKVTKRKFLTTELHFKMHRMVVLLGHKSAQNDSVKR